MLERLLPAPSRPLIKLHILWRKDGVPLTGGLSDYNRRLTIPSPAGGDSGYYECEAVLRSSSVPAVVRGAYLSVLGEAGRGGAAAGLPRGARFRGIPTAAAAKGARLLPLPLALPPAEPPQFVKEPERHITAEMEKVVDIPCRAKGNAAGGVDEVGGGGQGPPDRPLLLAQPHGLF